jgi:ParB family chromosome partitioning protein
MKTEVTRLRDLKLSARDQFMLDPSIIQIEKGHNPRQYKLAENRAHLDELKASIKENGVLQPVLVRYDAATKSAVLVDGECRLRAVLELIKDGVEIEAIPAIQVSGNNEAERLVISLTANTGKPLSKWESGSAFARLINFGWDAAKIASRLGFSERFVNEAMELSDAPEEVKELLSERAVTPSLALDHIRKSGTGATMTLRAEVEKAKSTGKTIAKRLKRPPQKGEKLVKLVKSLLSGVETNTLEDDEFKFVEVDRKALLAIRNFVEEN